MNNKSAESDLSALTKEFEVTLVVDNYNEQLAELFISENPQLYKANYAIKRASIKEYLKDFYNKKPSWKHGSWVYYPWNGRLLHVLDYQKFYKLRTIRNSYIIKSSEQQAYRDFNVGCAGMSVGSNGAMALVLTGGSEKIKLVDSAVFSGSNLNRVRTPLINIGIRKSTIIAREIYELNPYASIFVLKENLDLKNIPSFFDQKWPLALVVDEIDDVIAKIRLRIEARKRRIPVVMVTEPGDRIILDIERFDLDENLPIFHGLLPDAELIAEKGFKSEREKIRNIIKIIGVKYLPLRDQRAALKVGTKIPSAPQLGSTAMVAGGVISYAIRQIAADSPIKSGRQMIDLNNSFWKKKALWSEKKSHYFNSKELKRIVNSM